jgi:amino-acid N-acetyltransferase
VSNPLLRLARTEDIPTVEKLLAAEWLPPLMIAEFVETFWVLDQGGAVVGGAGLEVYGDAGVLRSVVVDPSLRGTGQGDRLVEEALAEARRQGIRRVYLFTMSAMPFFARYGFRPCTMEDFEPAVQASWQFVGISRMPEILSRITPMRLEMQVVSS